MPSDSNKTASIVVPPEGWPARKLQVVMACVARDLPILELAARKLAELTPIKSLHVVVRDVEQARFQSRLGTEVDVIAENSFIPGMTIEQLRQLPLEAFPRGAGWYFQQLLKLQFAFVDPADDYYLIWDADTIPLRPLRFFDETGRMLLTKATEFHAPYFETYRRLLGEEPNREFSFIAQHLLVQKSVVREMLDRIEQRFTGGGSWAWKLMRALPDKGHSLFSEYETCGHYVKNHYSERVAFIDRDWTRRGARLVKGGIPKESDLARLAADYDFAAFELTTVGWRGLKRSLVSWRRKVPGLEI
jgi:hypothetical protein